MVSRTQQPHSVVFIDTQLVDIVIRAFSQPATNGSEMCDAKRDWCLPKLTGHCGFVTSKSNVPITFEFEVPSLEMTGQRLNYKCVD